MIQRITKKEHDAIKRARKHGKTKVALLFKGANGWYYKNDNLSMAGVRECLEYQSKIKAEMGEATTLL